MQNVFIVPNFSESLCNVQLALSSERAEEEAAVLRVHWIFDQTIKLQKLNANPTLFKKSKLAKEWEQIRNTKIAHYCKNKTWIVIAANRFQASRLGSNDSAKLNMVLDDTEIQFSFNQSFPGIFFESRQTFTTVQS